MNDEAVYRTAPATQGLLKNTFDHPTGALQKCGLKKCMGNCFKKVD